MDLLQSIAVGFGTALTPERVRPSGGHLRRHAVGVLPGLGPGHDSLFLPITFPMEPVRRDLDGRHILRRQYGGSITSILVRIPGEAAAVVTCLDGYAMARQGRAGAALGIAAFGSFIAGVIATVALFLIGPAMAGSPFFGPVEHTPLSCWACAGLQLSSGSESCR